MLHFHGAVHGAFAAGRAIGEMQEKIVQKFDQDGSGDLSLEEAGSNERLARKFDRIDANDDGSLSAKEIGDHVADRMDRSFERFSFNSLSRMSGYAAKMHMERFASDDVGAAQAAANTAAVETFDAIDGDGDGVLSDAELAAEIAAQEAAAAGEAARQEKIATVNRIDSDGDGVLSMAELQAELKARQDARAEAEFNRIDSDGDGTLSDAEIEAEISAQAPPGPGPSTDEAVPQSGPNEVPAAAANRTPAEAVTEAPASNPAAGSTAGASAELSAPDVAAPAATAVAVDPVDTNVAAAGTPDDGLGETKVMSLIENVFQTMMEDKGVSGDIGAMSNALYTEAQELLLEQMENAAQFAANAYGTADGAVSSATNIA